MHQADGAYRPRQMTAMPQPAPIYQQANKSFTSSNPLGNSVGGGSVSFQSEQPIGQDVYGSLEGGAGGGRPSPMGRGVAPLPPMRPSPGGASFMGRDSWGPGAAAGTETTTAPADQSHGTYVV